MGKKFKYRIIASSIIMFLALFIIKFLKIEIPAISATANNMNEIPVVFAVDNNYTYPNIVTLTSLLENSKKDTYYKIYILSGYDFKEENISKILSLQNDYKNCHIESIKIGKEFDEYDPQKQYFTKAIFFRLKIPEILKKENKCIYLDSDIVVNSDLSELFNTDIKDFYIAGVRDGTPYLITDKNNNAYETKLKLFMSQEAIDKYVNSGVLLWNLEKIRKDNLMTKFQEFVDKYVFAKKISQFGDQDAINSACEGEILDLPFKFNVTAALTTVPYSAHAYVQKIYSREEWENGYKNPVIFHYTSGIKPWNSRLCVKRNLWWTYAKKSKFFDEISKMYKL